MYILRVFKTKTDQMVFELDKIGRLIQSVIAYSYVTYSSSYLELSHWTLCMIYITKLLDLL